MHDIIMIDEYYIYRNKCLNLIPMGMSAIVKILGFSEMIIY